MLNAGESFFFSCQLSMKHDALSYLWRICWAVDHRETRADRRDWRSRAVWDTRSLALLWRPCPAGRWWLPGVVAFLRARRTRNFLYPAATLPHPGSSPCATPRCCNANTRMVTAAKQRVPSDRSRRYRGSRFARTENSPQRGKKRSQIILSANVYSFKSWIVNVESPETSATCFVILINYFGRTSNILFCA